MGQLGTGRNNQIAENGLLYDKDGNVFDLTQWYKDNGFNIRGAELTTLSNICDTLSRIERHLQLMTDEEFCDTKEK